MRRLYLLLLTLLSLDAAAVGRLADVAVVDRDSGRTLETYYYRGEYWIAGTPGNRYAIAIHNRLNERVLAVAAVDGVNVVSGETAAWAQTGYVFGPYQAYDITGWRKSSSDVAAFEFTASPYSYAERTGRPANVGVIGIALFRERLPEREPQAIAVPSAPLAGRNEAARALGADAGTAAQAPDRLAEASAPAGAPAGATARFAPVPEAKLGTGHGERETSYVEHTAFTRLQSQPNEVIRIRYDSRENLLAMGVIRAPGRVPLVPNPFPESPGAQYVPDPPGYGSLSLR